MYCILLGVYQQGDPREQWHQDFEFLINMIQV
uniref:Uncharacterized protein n=1 Tax=Anguilla anguilla TaxID=7936 RepID=A0A0E9RNP7_ANGAN